MALVFAAALLLLKMAPPPGCADRVTKRRATRSVAGVLSASVAYVRVELVRGSGLPAMRA